ncbi:MAG: hypothetical protein ABI333_02090, partial [bacterium]
MAGCPQHRRVRTASSGALTRRPVNNGQWRAGSTLGLVAGFPGQREELTSIQSLAKLARGSPLSTVGRGEPLKEARRRA